MQLDSFALVGRRPRTPKRFEAGFQTQGDGRLQGPSFGTERCIALEAAADGGQLGLEHRGIYRLHPLRAAGERSRIQPEGQWPLGVAVEAGPLPDFGATDQAGAERVALDISQDHKQRWINIADGGDVVALVKDLRPSFGVNVENHLIYNGATAHDIRPYLTAKETGNAIATGLR